MHTYIHIHTHTYTYSSVVRVRNANIQKYGCEGNYFLIHTYSHTCIHTYTHTLKVLNAERSSSWVKIVHTYCTYIHTYIHTYLNGPTFNKVDMHTYIQYVHSLQLDGFDFLWSDFRLQRLVSGLFQLRSLAHTQRIINIIFKSKAKKSKEKKGNKK